MNNLYLINHSDLYHTSLNINNFLIFRPDKKKIHLFFVLLYTQVNVKAHGSLVVLTWFDVVLLELRDVSDAHHNFFVQVHVISKFLFKKERIKLITGELKFSPTDNQRYFIYTTQNF